MFEYSAKVVRIVDGDTLDAEIDIGFDVFVKKRIRLYGIDTWESRTRDLEEKALGLAAKSYVQGWLDKHESVHLKWLNMTQSYNLINIRISENNLKKTIGICWSLLISVNSKRVK